MDFVTVISTTLREKAKSLGVSESKISLVIAGSDVEHIRPVDKDQARSTLGFKSDWKMVAWSGYSHFDTDFLLEVFDHLAETDTRARLLLVGTRYFPADSTHREILSKHRDKILLAPPQPLERLSVYLSAADVLALPMRDTKTNRGRFPNKVGDYLAAARPIVTNPVGEVERFFKRFPVALFAAYEPGDFAEKVRFFFDHPEEAELLGAAARKVAEREVSWGHLAEVLEDILLRLASEQEVV